VQTIMVTGATGQLGRLTVQALLASPSTMRLAGLARDLQRGTDLARAGVELRQSDYHDAAGLVEAFTGIDTLLFIGTHAFTDRITQHLNVVDGAQRAGVQRIVYTQITRKAESELVLPEITEVDVVTEAAIRASGMAYTFLSHPPFLESLHGYVGGEEAYDTGVVVPRGSGRVAAATRADLAEAQATVLSAPGHEEQAYTLNGGPAVSLADTASLMSGLHGEPVPHLELSEEEFGEHLAQRGWSLPGIEFFTSWMRGINSGEWDLTPGDLAQLVGRSPTTAAEYFADRHHQSSAA
jgi:NAD(P)H dehydrogenase (quinone)